MSIYEVLSIALYLLIMIGIGIYSYRKSTENSNEFLISDRKLGPTITALSAGASDMSGWLLMGLPGALYLYGVSGAWIVIGLVLGAYLNYLIVAPRLRIYTEVAQNAITLPVFFENRFKDKSHFLKIVASLFILVFFTLYTSAGMVSGGRLFESAFGLDYQIGLWLTALVVVAYTFLGGFLAVSLTDFVQGVIMVIALLIVPMVVIYALGGYQGGMELINQKGTQYLNWFHGMKTVGIISLLAWGLGYFGQPHILVRFMAIEKTEDLKKARRIGIGWMLFTTIGAVLIGLFGIAYLYQFDTSTMLLFDQSGKDAETIFIYFARILFHPFVSGFLLSAILAAVMSTISSQLLVTASSLTEDIFRSFVYKNKEDKIFLLISRLSVVFIAVIAFLLALSPRDTILNLVGNAWAGFGAAFGPLILIALLWKKGTWQGALAGMLTGGLTVLLWIYIPHPFKDWYEIIPGFTLSLFVNILVSILTYQPNKEIEDEFSQVAKNLKGN